MRKSRLSHSKQQRLIELFIAGSTARTTENSVTFQRAMNTYIYENLCEALVPLFLVRFCPSVSVNPERH
jgi:transposase-like protein